MNERILFNDLYTSSSHLSSATTIALTGVLKLLIISLQSTVTIITRMSQTEHTIDHGLGFIMPRYTRIIHYKQTVMKRIRYLSCLAQRRHADSTIRYSRNLVTTASHCEIDGREANPGQNPPWTKSPPDSRKK